MEISSNQEGMRTDVLDNADYDYDTQGLAIRDAKVERRRVWCMFGFEVVAQTNQHTGVPSGKS